VFIKKGSLQIAACVNDINIKLQTGRNLMPESRPNMKAYGKPELNTKPMQFDIITFKQA